MKRILCFGDSNTYGYTTIPCMEGKAPARFDENIRWPSRLQKALGEEYHVYEEGLPGRTTVFDDPTQGSRNGLEHLESVFETCQPVDLVVIVLGTNDVRFAPHPFVVTAGLRRVVNRFQDLISRSFNPSAKILIVAPTEVNPDALAPMSYTKEWAEMIDQLPMFYKPLADELGCYFADGRHWGEPHISDGVHLGEEGHAVFAREIEKVIRSILE